jgi:hypothetical protein
MKKVQLLSAIDTMVLPVYSLLKILRSKQIKFPIRGTSTWL